MASKYTGPAASDSFRKLFECPVCFEPYKDPRLLNCGHQFCEKCLSGIIDQSPQQKICCPVCRDVTKRQHGDVKTLPKAILHQNIQDVLFRAPAEDTPDQKCTKCQTRTPTRHCPECSADLAYLCDQCFTVHHVTVKFDHNRICGDHPLKKMDHFCHTCNKATCVDCFFGSHGDHNTEPLDELAKARKQFVNDFLGKSRHSRFYMNTLAINEFKDTVTKEKKKHSNNIQNIRCILNTLDSQVAAIGKGLDSRFDECLANIAKYQTKPVETLHTRDRLLDLAETLQGESVSDVEIVRGSKDLHELPDIEQLEVSVPNVGNALEKLEAEIRGIQTNIEIHQAVKHITVIEKQERRKFKIELIKEFNCVRVVQAACLNKKDGTIVIRDSDKQHQIKVFNKAGKLLNKFGSESLSVVEPYCYENYSSIAIDTKRNLYLLPNNNGTLVRMEMDGRVKDTTKLGNNLCAVCYIPWQDKYAVTDYIDYGKSSVFLVSAETLNDKTELQNSYSEPFGICTDNINGAQTIVVSDQWTGKISQYQGSI